VLELGPSKQAEIPWEPIKLSLEGLNLLVYIATGVNHGFTLISTRWIY